MPREISKNIGAKSPMVRQIALIEPEPTNAHELSLSEMVPLSEDARKALFTEVQDYSLDLQQTADVVWRRSGADTASETHILIAAQIMKMDLARRKRSQRIAAVVGGALLGLALTSFGTALTSSIPDLVDNARTIISWMWTGVAATLAGAALVWFGNK